MSILPTPVVDYTDKDFDSLRVRLYNLLSSVFPEWTDQNVANFGNILVELFSHVGDVLGYYLDNHALESRFGTAEQRRSFIALGKLIGYTPGGATAGQADVIFSIPAALAGDVDIPAGTEVRTLAVTDPVSYQLLAGVTLVAGNTTVVGTVENSKSHVEIFSASGLQYQEVQLQNTPYLDTSAVISAGNGIYEIVENFLASTSTDLHVTLAVDQNDRATLRFGNGVNGQLPTGTIQINYKTGGGTAGNVDAETIKRVVGSFADTFGTTATLSVLNPGEASGGSERESIEQIRLGAPASIRTINRSVTREDYANNALTVGGVARAVLVTSQERAGIPVNSGMLHIVPTGGGLPSTALKDLVLTAVTETFPGMATFRVTVEDPDYQTIDVQATVFLSRGAVPATVDAAIRANLAAYMAVTNADGTPNTNIGFGADLQLLSSAAEAAALLGSPISGEVAFSDLYNVVRDTAGVRKIADTPGAFGLNGAALDVGVTAQQFPALGTVIIINGETGTALV